MAQREIMTVEAYRKYQAEQKQAKYRNKKVEIDGYTFDSLAEARRYEELCLMENAGAISDLRLQPKYELQRAFTDGAGVKQRAITYVADFAYNEVGLLVVEDVKGSITKEYAIKKKLFLFKYFDLIFREIKV